MDNYDNSNIDDNSNSETTPEVNEQDINDNNPEQPNNEQLGNGYNHMASSNREAFTKGLNENYNDRIARNKANLHQSINRSNEATKTNDEGEEKDKNILDKAGDKVNVLKNKASLLTTQIDSARSKAFQALHPVEAAKIVAKKKIQTWLIGILVSSLPLLLGIFVVFIACFMVLGLFGTASATGNNSSIVYESECNYEETMVTVMDVENTTVLATVSLEDYIIGCAVYEIGAYGGAYSILSDDHVKAQYIASKTWLLSTKNYNSSTKSIIVTASTKDQQWCDLEKGCYDVDYGNNLIGTFPGGYNGVKAERKLTDNDLETARRYYKETYGELYLPTNYNTAITSLGESTATFYVSTTQDLWEKLGNNGTAYDEILAQTGLTPGNPGAGYNKWLPNPDISSYYTDKSIYQLSSYCEATRISNNGTLVELEEYPDVKSSATRVNKPITDLLTNKEIENLNNYIISSVDKAGYGTGEAVAASAQSLIYGLYQHGYYLPYWYGGGHGKGISIGVDANWGKTGKEFDSYWYSWNIARNRNTYSYDCSGFISWAIKNACDSKFSPVGSNYFYNTKEGKSISLLDAKPGDMMVISNDATESYHIRVVLKNTGTSVITAESTPNAILFDEFTKLGGYKMVDMSNWYANNCNTSR